ncbi:hypothetical protein C7377_0938 [Balneicella halophila]|uniref:Outer membrane protein with beta-barrel domain n=1 Tax=Balneicella halophila TaxID=1537566 RepID=A0A7L4USE2_BALHA|nr:hypothetical protein [Balneicella halophila]PVX52609.1 hypothetical protein C7377_0938 [Balneicella halophila]
MFLFFCLKGYSQSNNEVRIFYGFADNDLMRASLDGDASYDNENCYELGVKYLRELKPQLSLETGVTLSSGTVKITSAYTGTYQLLSAKYEDFKIIAIPVYLNYTFGNYFFCNGGAFLHFQSKDRSFNTQSGIGFGLGIGAKYEINNFSFYINPTFKTHTVIPFQNEQYLQRLIGGSIQFGIGYTF